MQDSCSHQFSTRAHHHEGWDRELIVATSLLRDSSGISDMSSLDSLGISGCFLLSQF